MKKIVVLLIIYLFLSALVSAQSKVQPRVVGGAPLYADLRAVNLTPGFDDITGIGYGLSNLTLSSENETTKWNISDTLLTSSRRGEVELRLWGVTTTGGSGTNGTIFSLSTDGTSFIKYHDYDEYYDLAYLHDKLIPLEDGETIIGYSVPPKNVLANTVGQVFRINVDGTGYEVIHRDGFSYGGLMKTSQQSFYFTHTWANLWKGAILRSLSMYDEFTFVHAFDGRDGINPVSALMEYDGYLYGMTPRGGTNNNGNGVIYRLRMHDHVFEKIHDFTKEFGKNPEGSLIDGVNGFLYGMTTSGGSANYGSIFRVRPDGSEFEKLHDFNIANGRRPMGDLLLYGGHLYGMTTLGGRFKLGVIFRMNRNGSNYTILHHFSGIDGAEPLKNLIAYKGYLYGMTSKGGSNELGVIFKIKTNGADFTKLFDFDWDTGGAPDGTLTLIPTPVLKTAQTAASKLAVTDVEEPKPGFSIDAYPNPFSGVLYVHFEGAPGEEFTSSLIDLNGRTVCTQTGFTNSPAVIQTDIAAGIYLLKVKLGNFTRMIRVIHK